MDDCTALASPVLVKLNLFPPVTVAAFPVVLARTEPKSPPGVVQLLVPLRLFHVTPVSVKEDESSPKVERYRCVLIGARHSADCEGKRRAGDRLTGEKRIA